MGIGLEDHRATVLTVTVLKLMNIMILLMTIKS